MIFQNFETRIVLIMENEKKVNVILGDIDNSLFHSYPQTPGKPPIQDWLIKSNTRLLALQLLAIRTEQYDRVIIGYGTNRQDFRTDQCNPGGTCAPVLPLLQSYFQQELDCEVLIEPFLMADLYGSKPAGTSYRSILKEHYAHTSRQQHSRSLLDESKISLIYAQIHRAALNNPDAKQITIDFYDDSPGILYKLHHFFRAHPQMIPSNTILRLHHYEGRSPKSYGKPIQGTGIIDKFYVWTVRLFAAVTCYSPFENDEIQIRYANELKTYHNENRYFEPHRRRHMDVSVPNYDIDKLCTFRDDEIPTLGDKEIAHIQQPAYVTAQELYKSGLIPGEFVLHQHYGNGLYESPEAVELKAIKSRLSLVFNEYISCWKLSFFGHKHNNRAIEVLDALTDCQKIDEVKSILNNQYNLFTQAEYKSGPVPHLDSRWSKAKLIENPAKENRQSNYLTMISQAMRIADTSNLSEKNEPSGLALTGPVDSDVIIYTSNIKI